MGDAFQTRFVNSFPRIYRENHQQPSPPQFKKIKFAAKKDIDTRKSYIIENTDIPDLFNQSIFNQLNLQESRTSIQYSKKLLQKIPAYYSRSTTSFEISNRIKSVVKLVFHSENKKFIFTLNQFLQFWYHFRVHAIRDRRKRNKIDGLIHYQYFKCPQYDKGQIKSIEEVEIRQQHSSRSSSPSTPKLLDLQPQTPTPTSMTVTPTSISNMTFIPQNYSFVTSFPTQEFQQTNIQMLPKDQSQQQLLPAPQLALPGTPTNSSTMISLTSPVTPSTPSTPISSSGSTTSNHPKIKKIYKYKQNPEESCPVAYEVIFNFNDNTVILSKRGPDEVHKDHGMEDDIKKKLTKSYIKKKISSSKEELRTLGDDFNKKMNGLADSFTDVNDIVRIKNILDRHFDRCLQLQEKLERLC